MKNHSILSFIAFALLLGSCSPTEDMPLEELVIEYQIGDIGPAGGFVFYDKGVVSEGWQYIEMSAEDLEGMEWGCFDTPVIGARRLEVGDGKSNSEAIVEFHDALDDFYANPANCSENSDGTVAAKFIMDLDLGGYDDWYLPSEGEIRLIYENLHLAGLGDLDENYLYWSSTEHDDNTATAADFETGDFGYLCKQCHLGSLTKLRAVRYFQ